MKHLCLMWVEETVCTYRQGGNRRELLLQPAIPFPCVCNNGSPDKSCSKKIKNFNTKLS